jgi:two-component system, cell cycle response regulator
MESEMAETAKWSILVVDDNKTNITILVEILGEMYDISAALDGKTALKAAFEELPNLILLDIMMPEMDGYEVCRRLKSDPRTRRIPVIFITAMTDIEDEAKGFKVGAVDYITKPVSPPLVLARVRTHLELYDLNRGLEAIVRRRTSELRKSLGQIEEERARFQWVVEQADDGYLILNEDGIMVYANPRARLFLNLPEDDELPSETFLDLAKRRYRFVTKEAWRDLFSSAKSNPPCYLVWPESATASDFWLRADALAVQIGEQPGWVVHLVDTTEQVVAQRDQRAFTTMVRHKMRTPLISIVTGLELLERHRADLSSEELAETIQDASAGVRRLRSTIEDILEYANAPDLVISGERCPLQDIRGVVKDVAAGLEMGRVRISYTDGLYENSQLLLSRRALELIFWELLENSKKFHPGNTPAIGVNVMRGKAGEIILRVEDDGIAVSPEHLGKLWDPYYQGEKDFTGQVRGMGLGLAAVASLVWGSGGVCSAYNRTKGPGLVIELGLKIISTENRQDNYGK